MYNILLHSVLPLHLCCLIQIYRRFCKNENVGKGRDSALNLMEHRKMEQCINVTKGGRCTPYIYRPGPRKK